MAARVFDPQGYVAPVSIRARLFIQELWRSNAKWDDVLSDQIQEEWRSFYDELSEINQVRIPRWVETSPTTKIQIHIFCDASSRAFGAAAYVRVFREPNWSAMLLCSRSFVAPIKTITIPRLELLAVELGCKLIPKIHGLPTLKEAPVFIWTDSEIVLHWNRKPIGELKLIVANRVSRILSIASGDQLRHVRSEENPADLLSRGTKVESMLKSQLWWNGPTMLRESQEAWPVWNYRDRLNAELIDQIDQECKEQVVKFDNVMLTTIAFKNEIIDLIDKREFYRSTCRALVFRFLRRCYEPIQRRKGDTRVFHVTSDPENLILGSVEIIYEKRKINVPKVSMMEFENALNYWIRISQKQCFPNEHKVVSQGKPVSKSSKLLQLTPFMDHNKIMRIYGRLNKSELSADQKNPIILDYRCTLARRLAEEAHVVLAHGGAQCCTQYLRNKYWIINIRILTRRVVKNCVVCCRYRQKTATKLMADLPTIRTKPMPPFFHCGIDFAGPINLKESRNVTVKAYVAVFVCMVYKIVHLELVSGLDSGSFIAALTRFVNLRAGCIHHMYSDNGTNFVGANRLLREAVKSWQCSEVLDYLQLQSIRWHFNVPRAPHHGGLWEAAVKSAKHHLKRVGGAHLFTFEQLATLLAKIAACLNSRPLTPISNDPTDLQTLTPGHLLIGQPIITPFEEQFDERMPMNRLKAWQKIVKLQQDFWNRWSQEYISEQQRRNKWAGHERSFKEGDMVFVKNEVTPPSLWLMGRVIRVFTGADGRVRSCQLKTTINELERPITQLCLLPHEEDFIIQGSDDTQEQGRPSGIGFP